MTDNWKVVPVLYKWQDEPDAEPLASNIGVNVPEHLKDDPSFDNHILYYVDNMDELDELFSVPNSSEFVLIQYNN